MVVTVLKSSFAKKKPKEIIYRNFNGDSIKKNNLKVVLCKERDVENHYALLEKIFLQLLERKTQEHHKVYTIQINYCSRLYKKKINKCYNNLNINKVTRSYSGKQLSLFYLTMKLATRFANINLVDKENIISDDKDVVVTLNNFFENAAKSINITENNYILSNTCEPTDPVDITINKFQQHLSILAIKEHVIFIDMFNFSSLTLEEILREISSLDNNKAGTFKNIPTRLLKETSDICCKNLQCLEQ